MANTLAPLALVFYGPGRLLAPRPLTISMVPSWVPAFDNVCRVTLAPSMEAWVEGKRGSNKELVEWTMFRVSITCPFPLFLPAPMNPLLPPLVSQVARGGALCGLVTPVDAMRPGEM